MFPRVAFVLISACLLFSQQDSTANQTPPSPPVQQTNSANVPTPTAAPKTYDITVAGDRAWVDSGVDVHAGDRLVFSSEGEVTIGAKLAGPVGLQRGWRDLIKALPVNDAGSGALVGRISNNTAAVPFLVGASRDIVAASSGRLFLGVNQSDTEKSAGAFKVKLQVVPGTVNASTHEAAKTVATTATAAPMDAKFLEQLPRRISDMQGNKGDMVNFVVIGTQDRLLSTFQQAGWVSVDKTKQDALLHAALSTLTKKSYLEMPMSELYLFGRAQDFGFARAEPVQVVASRHHLRIWKAPIEVGGQPLWVGAATHDIGFEKDNRTGGVTHRIDQNVDDEREFVGSSLNETGMVQKLSYVLPPNPVQEEHTATGGTFRSDGRVLVIVLH